MIRLLWAFLLLVPNLALAEPPALVRVALVAGSNDGGPSRVKLRYAVTDAQAMARVLTSLGGVDPKHMVVLQEPDRAQLLQALDTLRSLLTLVRAGQQRVEVLVYYSGHSDEAGLLPGGQALTYAELRQRLQGLPADVRIAILDSCASGALLRAKGGVHKPAFLLDASSQVSGHAYLTSSSADEAAQESDALGASYFTANLVAGLRGAADVSGDRRVTLSEAYQYAFHRTLSRTEQTRRGPQHPAYDFDLAGSGDVVITDLAVVSSVLVLDPALRGRVLVRDESGRLVVELDKAAGRKLELGLEPGIYRVVVIQGSGATSAARQGQAVLTRGQKTLLTDADFTQLAVVPTRARGDEPEDQELDEDAGAPHVGVSIGLLPGLATGVAAGETDAVVDKLAFDLLGGVHRSVHGLAIAPLFQIERATGERIIITGGFHLAGGRGRGIHLTGGLDYAGQGDHLVALSGGASVVRGDQRGLQIAGGTAIVGGDLHGLQVSAGLNVAGGEVRGLQVVGGLNVAAGELHGVQVGTVNVAGRSQGFQFGVLNIAGSGDGDALGVLSLLRDGYHHCEAWTGEVAVASLGCKLGGRHFYNLLAVGLGVGPQTPRTWGYGVGLHFDLGRLYTDVDVVAHQRFALEQHGILTQLRLAFGLPVLGRLAVFAGASLDTAVGWDAVAPPETAFGSVWRSGDASVRVGPGLFVGLGL